MPSLVGLIIVAILTSYRNRAAEHLTVAVDQETLRGVKLKTIWDKEYLAFRGIPYAKPPIDKLRFRVSYIPCNRFLYT
jgi:hypothetical protein